MAGAVVDGTIPSEGGPGFFASSNPNKWFYRLICSQSASQKILFVYYMFKIMQCDLYWSLQDLQGYKRDNYIMFLELYVNISLVFIYFK